MLQPTLRRSLRPALGNNVCVFCSIRKAAPRAIERTKQWGYTPNHLGRRPGSSASPTSLRRKKNINQPAQTGAYDPFRPSNDFLQDGHKSGFLKIQPAVAKVVLLEYQALGNEPTKTQVDALLKEHNVPPSEAVQLARAMARSSDPRHQHRARKLLLTLSALKEPTATFFLVTLGYRQDVLHAQELRAPLEHLRVMVKEANPVAMVIMGQIKQNEGNVKEAEKLFVAACDNESKEKSASEKQLDGNQGIFSRIWGLRHRQEVSAPKDGDPIGEALVQRHIEGQDTLDISHAWTSLGHIRLKRKDLAGAKAAFEHAALKRNDPGAYYHLAELEAGPDDMYTKKRIGHYLTAAQAGDPRASIALAQFYSLTEDEIRAKVNDEETLELFLGSRDKMFLVGLGQLRRVASYIYKIVKYGWQKVYWLPTKKLSELERLLWAMQWRDAAHDSQKFANARQRRMGLTEREKSDSETTKILLDNVNNKCLQRMESLTKGDVMPNWLEKQFIERARPPTD